MGFRDEIERILSNRAADRESAESDDAERVAERNELIAQAVDDAREAATLLAAAEVPFVRARLAHKERTNWRWPTGRQLLEGWVLHCGDQSVLLRRDGWLGGVHECDDPRRTYCACALVQATTPLPELSMTVGTPPEAAPDGPPNERALLFVSSDSP